MHILLFKFPLSQYLEKHNLTEKYNSEMVGKIHI